MFHSQQAAEKTLEAFLAAHERPFPKTHDLDLLGTTVIDLDPTLADVVVPAHDLTPYAWRFRYPGTPLGPSEDEARVALDRARAVFEAILVRLPGDVQP